MAKYYFNNKTGRYHDSSNNVFVSRRNVLKHLDLESARMKTRLQGHGRLLATGKIAIEEWQTRMMQDIKQSHIRLGLLGAGGDLSASYKQYGAIGQRLREEYDYLKNFAEEIYQTPRSEQYIIWRSGLYGNSGASAFYKAEQISRIENGATLAKRLLDANAQHCQDCLTLHTNGKWLPIQQVTLPTRNCACRSRCRCIYTTK